MRAPLQGSTAMPKASFKIAVTSLIAASGAMAALWGAWAAPATSPQALTDAAYQAMGGDKLAGLKTLSLDESLQQWDPRESESGNDPLKPDWGKATRHETWDLPRGLVHTEWSRPKASPGLRTYSETITSDAGYVTGIDGNGAVTRRAIMVGGQSQHTMSGVRLTTTLREQERQWVVTGMHAHPDRVSDYPAQTVGGKKYPAAQYRGDWATFIVM